MKKILIVALISAASLYSFENIVDKPWSAGPSNFDAHKELRQQRSDLGQAMQPGQNKYNAGNSFDAHKELNMQNQELQDALGKPNAATKPTKSWQGRDVLQEDRLQFQQLRDSLGR